VDLTIKIDIHTLASIQGTLRGLFSYLSHDQEGYKMKVQSKFKTKKWIA
jgi:hypothetical protein